MTGNKKLSWELYMDALGSDYVDIQGGTTGEGIHAGVMAGTILIALNTFAGINYRGNMLSVDPGLPESWTQMKFKLHFKGISFEFRINKTQFEVKSDQDCGILVAGISHKIEAGISKTISY